MKDGAMGLNSMVSVNGWLRMEGPRRRWAVSVSMGDVAPVVWLSVKIMTRGTIASLGVLVARYWRMDDLNDCSALVLVMNMLGNSSARMTFFLFSSGSALWMDGVAPSLVVMSRLVNLPLRLRNSSN